MKFYANIIDNTKKESVAVGHLLISSSLHANKIPRETINKIQQQKQTNTLLSKGQN